MDSINAANKFAEIVNAQKIAIAKVWTQGARVRVYLTWPKGGSMGYQDFTPGSGSGHFWATSGDGEKHRALRVARDQALAVSP